MAKLDKKTTAGFNAGKNYYARLFRVEDIVIDPDISKIFKISDATLNDIIQKMKAFGYDKSQPVVVQKGTNILLDGHTRLAAAKAAGLEEIPVEEKEFDDREKAILYTIERQVLRRNLTGAEILTATKMIHGRKARDGKGRAAEILAEKLKVSPATIYQSQAILKEAPQEDIEAVMNGEASIKGTYNKLKKSQKPDPVFTVNGTQSLPEKISFLRGAVILLVQSKQLPAAKLLIDHYIRKKHERSGFYNLLPEEIRNAQLE